MDRPSFISCACCGVTYDLPYEEFMCEGCMQKLEPKHAPANHRDYVKMMARLAIEDRRDVGFVRAGQLHDIDLQEYRQERRNELLYLRYWNVLPRWSLGPVKF